MRPIQTSEVVTPQFDVRDCIELLSSCPDMLVFPVVKSRSDYTILGDVQRRDVERTIDSASKRDGVLRRRETDENEDDLDDEASLMKEKQFHIMFKDPVVGTWCSSAKRENSYRPIFLSYHKNITYITPLYHKKITRTPVL